MFVLGIPILEKMVRPIVVYVFLIVGLRLAGKRSLASLNSFDLVVLLTISNTVQNAIIGDDNSVTGGVVGATTLLVVNYAVVRFFFAHPKLDEFVEGKATVLMDGGKVLEDNLHKELITKTELEVAARRQGFNSLDEVERATLEPGGAIAVFGRQPSLDEQRSAELLARIDQLSEQIKQLQASLGEQRAMR
jgi:uncharacterized membrane protein YcaP (DUF421 family)